MKAVLASIVAVIGVALGQQTCEWYNWGTDDWPGTNQNFSLSVYSKDNPHSYLDTNNFQAGGDFAGQKWQDVFFTNPYYYRPLGFRYGILGAWNVPTICLNVTGGGNYLVELMVYSFTPGASIAASDLGEDQFNLQSNGVTTVSGKSKLYACFVGPTDPSALMHLSIYCPRNNCQEIETHLLWRLRKSTVNFVSKSDFASGNPEMWCMTIGSNIKWPDQINGATPQQYSNANANEYRSGALQVSVMLGTLLSVLFAVFQ
jgi:hypothetical protein